MSFGSEAGFGGLVSKRIARRVVRENLNEIVLNILSIFLCARFCWCLFVKSTAAIIHIEEHGNGGHGSGHVYLRYI